MGKCLNRFFNSFGYDYDPPNAKYNPSTSLKSAIIDCSNQGKLLILNLTLNNKKIEVPLDMPEEDFIVYTAPFNSQCAFDICRSYAIDSLPFIGLFFCPTRNPADAQLIDKIVDIDDLFRASNHIRQLSQELYDRRAKYIAHQSNRTIITDQDQQYEEVLKEAQRIEEEKMQEEKKKKEAIENREQKVQNALRRYNSMPAPPPKDSPHKLSVKFMIANQPPKFREFFITDKAKLLYDYVSVDFAPNEPKITFGFPTKTLSTQDFEKTFAELKFAKKETVFVDSDDDEEEEDDE